MLFVKTEKLKIGMRSARPIYNKDGTLLYERNSKLTDQGISAVKNFGLIGMYILESGEPAPPMTEDDIEFERFQSVTVFTLRDELKYIKREKKKNQLEAIADSICAKYSYRNKTTNFVQNLRSNEDYVVKHSLNVAILCAMMAGVMQIKQSEIKNLVCAALLHDIGKLDLPDQLVGKEDSLTNVEEMALAPYKEKSLELIEAVFAEHIQVKRIALQADRLVDCARKKDYQQNIKTPTNVRILIVAEIYDVMTAMNDYKKPTSDIAALKYLLDYKEFFGNKTVNALISSVNFLAEGCCVELSNGKEGLVLARNSDNILRPRVLCFEDNAIIELDEKGSYEKIEIKDAMKTLDNRYIIDKKTLEEYQQHLEEMRTQEIAHI